jgi:hypothetical protein
MCGGIGKGGAAAAAAVALQSCVIDGWGQWGELSFFFLVLN